MKKATYRWSGLNAKGQALKGVIKAENVLQAKLELEKQGIFIIKMVKKRQLSLQFSALINAQDCSFFSRQLASLLSAGIPLVPAFDIIIKGATKANLKEVVTEIKNYVEQGTSFAEALTNYPEFFNYLFCQLIHAGEKSGALILILNNLANYLEQSKKIRKKIKKALAYPLTCLALALLITGGLLIGVIPQFASLFNAFGAKLPFFTRSIIGLSQFLQNYWHFLLAFLSVSLLLFFYTKRHSSTFSSFLDHLFLKIPCLGTVLLKIMISRFTRTLAITLTAGLPLLSALETAQKVTENKAFLSASSKLGDAIACGQSFKEALEKTQLFPAMVIQMVAIGEESGSLSPMLNKIADYYEEEVATTIDTLTSLLEPLIMAILALLIGGLILAIYTPIFKLGSIL